VILLLIRRTIASIVAACCASLSSRSSPLRQFHPAFFFSLLSQGRRSPRLSHLEERKGTRMDPQVVWEHLLDAYSDQDWDAVDEHAATLRDWLEKGGFPPQTVPHRELRPPVNRLIALATCRLALEHSQREAPHDASSV
jgi:hypothetical protein